MSDASSESIAETPPPGRWLNQTVIGVGVTSFLADLSYETARAALPGFMAVLSLPAAALGVVEGVADGLSSFVKLATGWWSDRIGHRKGIVTIGYAFSGGAMGICFALAAGLPMILLGRVLAWLGKGIRGPLRDAILAESIDPADRGKAFGFHRAGDTLGAVVGPALGAGLLWWLQSGATADPTGGFRTIFWLTLLPGFGAALAFAVLVHERRRTPNPGLKFWASLAALPVGFKRLLLGVGLFGAGDFSHTLLTFAAIEALTPAHGNDAFALGALLYGLRNVVEVVTAYPIGHLSDRIGRRGLLAAGYALGGLTMFGFLVAFATRTATLPILGVLFALAGAFIAVEEALEGAMTADCVPDVSLRGTAYGVMGTVTGLGDLVSSIVVGLLWTAVGYEAGFGFAGVVMLAGSAVLYRVR